MRKLLTTVLLACILSCGMTSRAEALLAMQISGISDFSLGTWNIGDPTVKASINICIYTYDLFPIGGYAITASSPGGYKLVNGAHTLDYSLSWDDGGSGNLGVSAQPLSNGVKLTGRLRGNILDSSCTLSGPNARLNLSINQADMTAAIAGTYTGTVTLLLTPT